MRLDEINSISNFVNYFPLTEDKELRKSLWRKRGIHEILDSGYSTGCTDRAMIFMHFARGLGFPTTYVETVDKRCVDDLRKGLLHKLDGHVFCDVESKDNVVHINPGYGRTRIIEGCYIREESNGSKIRYEVLGRGTGYNNVFLRSGSGFESKPVSLRTPEEIRLAAQKVFVRRPF
jgi:hypothetical protein